MSAATIAAAALGVALIIGLTAYLIADAIAWSGYGSFVPWRGRWVAVTAVLIVAWLAAELLR
ncbi:MAG: hypothetical protein ACYDCL_21400 [Myxococcales bacterium]